MASFKIDVCACMDRKNMLVNTVSATRTIDAIASEAFSIRVHLRFHSSILFDRCMT